MSYAWLMAPHEYEPDYDAYINEMYSLEEALMGVATYDDWFPDLNSPIAAVQQGGAGLRCIECGEPQFVTPHGICCANGHGGAPSL